MSVPEKVLEIPEKPEERSKDPQTRLLDKVTKALSQEWDKVLFDITIPLPEFRQVCEFLMKEPDYVNSLLGSKIQILEASRFNRSLNEGANPYRELVLIHFVTDVKDPKTGVTSTQQYCEPVLLTGTQASSLKSVIQARARHYVESIAHNEKESLNRDALNSGLKAMFPTENQTIISLLDGKTTDTLQVYSTWAAVYDIMLRSILSKYPPSPWKTSGIQACVLMLNWFSYERDQEIERSERKHFADNIRLILDTSTGVMLRKEIIDRNEDYIESIGLSLCEEILEQTLLELDPKPLLENMRDNPDQAEPFLETIVLFRGGTEEEYLILNRNLLSVFRNYVKQALSLDQGNPGFFRKYLIEPWRKYLFLDLYSTNLGINLKEIADILKDDRKFVDYVKTLLPHCYPVLADIQRFFEENPAHLKMLCAIQDLKVSDYTRQDGSAKPLWAMLGLKRADVINTLGLGRGFSFVWQSFTAWLRWVFGNPYPRHLLDVVVSEEQNLKKRLKSAIPSVKTVPEELSAAPQTEEDTAKKKNREALIQVYFKLCETYLNGKRESDLKKDLETSLQEWNIRPAIADSKARTAQEQRDRFDIDEKISHYLPTLQQNLNADALEAVVIEMMKVPPASNVVRKDALKRYIIASLLIFLRPV